MIEEAAGTSMYETKREDTAKMMEKKDTKIQEINEVMSIWQIKYKWDTKFRFFFPVTARRHFAEVE